MEQIVRVHRLCGSGRAQIIHVRESACSGDCHKCSGCGAAKETMILEADNPIGARPGDMVVLRSDTKNVMTAVAVVYVLPVVLFFVGYALGAMASIGGGLMGCLGFALGLWAAVRLDRSRAKKNQTVYTITGFAADWLGSERKGDNDLG